MRKCPVCGTENDDESRFCEECGNAIPQTKACPRCHAEQKLTAKFCSQCRYSFQAQAADGQGSLLGGKNVIAGDIVQGPQDNSKNFGTINETTVINQDETKKLETCSLCGHRVLVTESFECPECHRTVCLKCKDEGTSWCRACTKSETEKRKTDYRKTLEEVYVNGLLARPEDRLKLDNLQRRLGLSTERAAELENEIKKAQAGKCKTDELTTIECKTLKLAYGLY